MHDRSSLPPAWVFAIDRGGTFTDVVAQAPDGSWHTTKVLSRDPMHPGDPALRAIRLLLAQHGARLGRRVASVRLGTTVATNALLERKGASTLLLTTLGLADALAIGYQERPDIFARAIRRPSPLYDHVRGVPERVDAEGSVLHPLDESALQVVLAEARALGVQSIAIVFLHGYRHPAHERRAAELAREAGFIEVVASHEAVPLLGYVARGDTTVADAYLSPVLLQYVRDLASRLALELDCTDVTFMQSNGGLVDAQSFRGVHGVLSGPAGGVVGMVAAGMPAGPRALVGFDMGGTSTDVSLSTGEIPRRFAAEIDGVRLQVPLVDLDTIAAGGGSVLRLAEGRLQVGPLSAGADPGPACYRRGGPATITDCNVVLGRIPVAAFPRVFGADGTDPIDAGAARASLLALVADAKRETGHVYEAETLAQAFVDVAVARMANAIHELALKRGEDPARFALFSFGGAGGQHACAIADRLGVTEVLLHPLAGVLSAYGIALATRRAIRRQTLECALDHTGHAVAEARLRELAALAEADLRTQGVPAQGVHLRCSVHLRTAGSDTAIGLPWQESDALRQEFLLAHRRLYGFVDEQATLVLATAMVEAVERNGAVDRRAHSRHSTQPPVKTSSASLPTRATVWFDGAWHEVALVHRDALRTGEPIAGPLLLCEVGATSWIAPGWTGISSADGLLALRRTEGACTAAAGPRDAGCPDPMRLEVFNALFMHVAEQMGAVLRQTASSVNIKERLDYSCALFDAEANLVANAPHMPVHLGSMGASVSAVVETFRDDLRPGDAYIVNSPYDGGTHLPDITVVCPVFDAAGAHARP